MARRKDRPAAIDADEGSDIQCHDNCDCVRKHVGVELSRHFDHGRADGPVAAVHDGGRGVLPAGSDGSAAANVYSEQDANLRLAAE